MATEVFGREAELAAIDAMLASARCGFAAMLVAGDAGIGKTTVWRQGIANAAGDGFRVLSCRASPNETRLSFAALGDLLTTVDASAFDTLPEPQRRALDAALLRKDAGGQAPNPRAIGTGVVSLFTRLSHSAPLLLAIDDVQWLDLPSTRALEFALRRLVDHPCAVLATLRLGEGSKRSHLLSPDADARVHNVRLGPLSLGALYRIVETELGHGLPRPTLVRIERAAAGNPFYTLEFARALASEGPAASRQELPIPADLRDLVAKRLRRLPQRTREALLTVSALAQPTIERVDAAQLAPAEEAGMVRILANGRIEFTHPLFASGIYATASHARRCHLHAELAEIAGDVEERARHLMLARSADGADEHVAEVLHEAADHAYRRGALEVAADLAEHAARQTPPDRDDLRPQRTLRAARHHLKSGDHARAKALCEEVLAGAPPGGLRAQALVLLGEAAVTEAPPTALPLLEEALACAGDDSSLAAQILMSLAVVRASLLEWPVADALLQRAVDLAETAGDSGLIAAAIALKSLSGLLTGQGFDEAVLERALALEDRSAEVPFQMRATLNVASVYGFSAHVDRAHALLLDLRDQLVASGDEADLPWVLGHLAGAAWLSGDFDSVERYGSDAERLAALTGVEVFRPFALMVRAMGRALRGDGDGARADAAETIAISERIGWPVGVAQARGALGVLALSEDAPEEAAAVLDPVVQSIESLGVYERVMAMPLPDAIEAFVSTGDTERAARLAQALDEWGRRFDRPWALATGGRGRALVAAAKGELDGALAAVEEAVIAHERLPMPFELARTLLVQGQILRRRGERRSGRGAFQRALSIFERIGAMLWAEKTRAEIARIGVRRAPEELTEGEDRVAALAAQGLTNPEIAARLFMSRRTVEANLARAYGKLGIRSRAELGAVMAKRKLASS